jgi:hypothetical protein
MAHVFGIFSRRRAKLEVLASVPPHKYYHKAESLSVPCAGLDCLLLSKAFPRREMFHGEPHEKHSRETQCCQQEGLAQA